MGARFGKNLYLDYTFFYNLDLKVSTTPLVNGQIPLLRGKTKTSFVMRDKHWTPLIVRDKHAFFVRYYDPLQVLACELPSGKCHIAFPRGPEIDQNYNDFTHCVRGGTQFLHLDGDYYWSFVHVTLFPFVPGVSDHTRLYTTNFLILHINPFRVVFISDPVRFSETIFSETDARNYTRFRHFVWPNAMINDGTDGILLGVHVDDTFSAIVRVAGFKNLLLSAVKKDQNDNSSRKGPKQGQLHEQARQLAKKFLRPGEQFKVNWRQR